MEKKNSIFGSNWEQRVSEKKWLLFLLFLLHNNHEKKIKFLVQSETKEGCEKNDYYFYYFLLHSCNHEKKINLWFKLRAKSEWEKWLLFLLFLLHINHEKRIKFLVQSGSEKHGLHKLAPSLSGTRKHFNLTRELFQ
jgi:hypothetical protein